MKHIFITCILLGFSIQAFSECLGTSINFSTLDPRDQSPWEISSRQYLPKLTATPVLFILPTILGESKLERQIAYNFCRAGLAVYILNTVRTPTPETTSVDWTNNDFILIRAKTAVSAAKDTSVPTVYQQELRNAIASPLVLETNNSHVGTIQNVTYYNFKDMLAFFKVACRNFSRKLNVLV